LLFLCRGAGLPSYACGRGMMESSLSGSCPRSRHHRSENGNTDELPRVRIRLTDADLFSHFIHTIPCETRGSRDPCLISKRTRRQSAPPRVSPLTDRYRVRRGMARPCATRCSTVSRAAGPASLCLRAMRSPSVRPARVSGQRPTWRGSRVCDRAPPAAERIRPSEM
jgi:hypothetical protein